MTEITIALLFIGVSPALCFITRHFIARRLTFGAPALPTEKCPRRAEMIKAEAKVCGCCGRDV